MKLILILYYYPITLFTLDLQVTNVHFDVYLLNADQKAWHWCQGKYDSSCDEDLRI